MQKIDIHQHVVLETDVGEPDPDGDVLVEEMARNGVERALVHGVPREVFPRQGGARTCYSSVHRVSEFSSLMKMRLPAMTG